MRCALDPRGLAFNCVATYVRGLPGVQAVSPCNPGRACALQAPCHHTVRSVPTLIPSEDTAFPLTAIIMLPTCDSATSRREHACPPARPAAPEHSGVLVELAALRHNLHTQAGVLDGADLGVHAEAIQQLGAQLTLLGVACTVAWWGGTQQNTVRALPYSPAGHGNTPCRSLSCQDLYYFRTAADNICGYFEACWPQWATGTATMTGVAPFQSPSLPTLPCPLKPLRHPCPSPALPRPLPSPCRTQRLLATLRAESGPTHRSRPG